MLKQLAIPCFRDAMKKRVTCREKLRAEMDGAVPQSHLFTPAEPHYPKTESKGSHPPMPLETMLRVYFLQSRYAPSNPTAEDNLYSSEAICQFVGMELGYDDIPD